MKDEEQQKDRMPTQNLVMVLKKMHAKNTKGTSLNTTFSLKATWCTKRLRVEGLGYIMLHGTKGIKKYIGDIASSRERNIVYSIFFRTRCCWEEW
jgi:hypothetical protein